MKIPVRPSKRFLTVLARCFLLSLAALFALIEMTNAQVSSGSITGSVSDQTVEQNAGAFYDAVLRGNRAAAAKYASFPCTYFLNGKRLFFKNSAAFLEQYDHIFSPEFVAKIAADVPHHMSSNWQGIMIADGAVWFDEHGKAKHLNNPK
jgi:hypothetical protein